MKNGTRRSITPSQVPFYCAPGGTRTPDLRIRRPLLYPAELLRQHRIVYPKCYPHPQLHRGVIHNSTILPSMTVRWSLTGHDSKRISDSLSMKGIQMETQLTVRGNVATAPRRVVTDSGTVIVEFRLAATERILNRQTQEWEDGNTSWYSVTAFRRLAENIFRSFSLGDPVTVAGKIAIK